MRNNEKSTKKMILILIRHLRVVKTIVVHLINR